MQFGRLGIGLIAAAAACQPAMAAAAAPQGSGRQFDIMFMADVTHDTNLPRTSALEASRSNLVLEDTSYTPNVNLNLRYPVGRQSLFLDGQAGYVFHDRNSVLDSERVNVTAGVDTRISICSTRFSGGYVRSLSDLQDISLATTITNKIRVETVSLNAQCGRRTGIGANFTASQDWGDNSAAQMRVQDYRAENYQAGFTYAKPALGVITLFASYGHSLFPNRPRFGGEEDGFDNTAGGITYDRHLGARIEGKATVAYSNVTELVHNPLLPGRDFSGITYSFDGKYRVTRKLSTDLLFERAIKPSTRIGSTYDLRTDYRFNANYDLSRRFKLRGSYERVDDKSSATGPLAATTLTNSHANIGSAGVEYDLGRRISLTLDGAQEQRKTNNTLFDYRDTRVTAGVRVRY